MAKLTNRLSTRTVDTAKPGLHADGNGLYLAVSPKGAKRWTLIFQWEKKRAEMSLGAVDDISLAEARELAGDARRMVREGVNPIEARKPKADAGAAPALDTFGAFAESLIESLEGGFRNEKHKAQWRMSLSVARDKETGELLVTGYCRKLRNKRLDEIGTDDVLAVLQPIWTAKAETASRLRGRIERVLDAAKARGLRSGENPARWRGHLNALLSKRQKLQRGHHAAMPYADVPAFVTRLHAERQAMAALALEWTILAAARTGETLGARLSEVDRKAKVWTVPAARMKAGREHRVPLTPRMLEILAVADKVREVGNDHLFPGPGIRKPLSGMAMTMLLRRMKVEDVTVHGFRSAFRDWVGEETFYRPDLAEAALAHVVGDATVQAYRRGDALEARRQLMTEWAGFVGGTAPAKDVADAA